MKIYEFGESCWANVPKIAIVEADIPEKDVEWVSIVLAEGKNFDPEYLKINPNGTVPTLVVGGQTYTDSTTVVSELLKRAPHPPRVSAHTSTSIVEEVHGANHDPNATLLMSVSDEDREAKIKGIPKGFLQGRQDALDKYAPEAPAEFKKFLEEKQKGNRQLLEFYTGNPDDAAKRAHYKATKEMWTSAGIVIRGVITQALQKTGGPFAGGDKPGEPDFHIITWLARMATNAGVEPGSPASVAIPKLQEKTGGHAFDPVVSKYWDAWTQRESFKKNNIH